MSPQEVSFLVFLQLPSNSSDFSNKEVRKECLGFRTDCIYEYHSMCSFLYVYLYFGGV